MTSWTMDLWWSMDMLGNPTLPVSVIPSIKLFIAAICLVSHEIRKMTFKTRSWKELKMPKGNVQSYQYRLSVLPTDPVNHKICDSYLPMDSHSMLRFCLWNLYALESLQNKHPTWHNTLTRGKRTTLKERYGRVRYKVAYTVHINNCTFSEILEKVIINRIQSMQLAASLLSSSSMGKRCNNAEPFLLQACKSQSLPLKLFVGSIISSQQSHRHLPIFPAAKAGNIGMMPILGNGLLSL